MTLSTIESTGATMSPPRAALSERAARLSQEFEKRADAHDCNESFVSENYARLAEEGLVSAGVPVELGGEGAGVRDLCGMIRHLAHGCGSTALGLAMHSHQVAIPAWRWHNQPAVRAAVEPLLRKVASTNAILLTSGGNDWVGGAKGAERVDGGYRIKMRKAFVSGSPAGAMLITGAVADGEVVHFAVPMDAPEVRILDTWHTLGMRGTASNDVEIDGFFVADDKVALKRKAGEWHPLFWIIATTALPIIYSAYLGIAESARDIAVTIAGKRSGEARNLRLAGEMDTALHAARLAHQAMIAVVERNAPSAETVNEVMFGRRLIEENAIRTVGLAMDLAGGAGFYRANGLERRFRDVQGARYHPMRRDRQELFAGAMALGESVANIY